MLLGVRRRRTRFMSMWHSPGDLFTDTHFIWFQGCHLLWLSIALACARRKSNRKVAAFSIVNIQY